MARAFRDRARTHISSELAGIAERAARQAGATSGYMPDLRSLHADLQQLQPLIQVGPPDSLPACVKGRLCNKPAKYVPARSVLRARGLVLMKICKGVTGKAHGANRDVHAGDVIHQPRLCLPGRLRHLHSRAAGAQGPAGHSCRPAAQKLCCQATCS